MNKELLIRIVLLLVFGAIIIFFEYMNYTTTGNFSVSPYSGALVIIGGSLNLLTISMNGWKMPVYDKESYGHREVEEKYPPKGIHYAFKDKKKVKLFWLCDRFPMKIKKYTAFFSIGDIIIVLGIVMLVTG